MGYDFVVGGVVDVVAVVVERRQKCVIQLRLLIIYVCLVPVAVTLPHQHNTATTATATSYT